MSTVIADISLSLVQMFPDDQVTTGNVQEVAMEGHSDQMSSEDHDSMEVMTYQVSKYNLLYKILFFHL